MDLFTEIHLPIQVTGEWMMMICTQDDVERRHTFKLVVFNHWDWNREEVKRLLEVVALRMRELVLEEGFKTH